MKPHDPKVRIQSFSDGKSKVVISCACGDDLSFTIESEHLAALGHTAVSVATSLGLDTNVKVKSDHPQRQVH